MEYVRDASGRALSFKDTQGYEYGLQYDNDGYVTHMAFPNGTSTETVFRPDHTIQSRTTQGPNGEPLVAAGYEHNARDFVTKADENGRVSEFGFDAREQLNRVTTPEGDVILYEYDASGNRTVRKAIIQGAESDKQETIDTEQFMEMILGAMNGKAGEAAVPVRGGQRECLRQRQRSRQ